jgi:endogenous inhibitor of DNA gyrase (YacG/DUF329 family)
MKHHCPICSAPTDSHTSADFPFCCERCKDIDLGNWATEKYKISEPAFDEDELERLVNGEPSDTQSQQKRHDSEAEEDQ